MILTYMGPLFICWSIFAYCKDFVEIFASVDNSAVSLIPRSQAPWCCWLHWVKLSGVVDCTESSSVVLLIARSQAQRCCWLHGVKLSGVVDCMESSSAVLLIARSQPPWCCWEHGTESSSAVLLTLQSKVRHYKTLKWTPSAIRYWQILIYCSTV